MPSIPLSGRRWRFRDPGRTVGRRAASLALLKAWLDAVPVIALLGIIIATASILSDEQVPMISFGSVSTYATDVLLVGLLGIVAVRVLADREFRLAPTPLNRPLVIFFAVTLFSTVVGIMRSSLEVSAALRTTRVFSYYLTFFIVTNLVRTRRQLAWLLNGFVSIATVVALAMVLQYVIGESVTIVPGRVETLQTQGAMVDGVTRILPPGISIVLVAFLTILAQVAVGRSRKSDMWRLLLCGALALALMVTFLRSYWATLLAVIVLLVALVRGSQRRKLARRLGAGVVALCLLLAFAAQDPGSGASRFLRASWDRLSTLGRSDTFVGYDDTAEFRRIEAEYAFADIAAHPIIGLGMGAKYRPWDARLDYTKDGVVHDLSWMIHNGHLWILVQSGLLGYASFLWLSIAFLWRGFRYWRGVPDERLRGVVLGFALAFLAVFLAAVANSSFMAWYWTPVLGIMMGVNEVILRWSVQEHAIA